MRFKRSSFHVALSQCRISSIFQLLRFYLKSIFCWFEGVKNRKFYFDFFCISWKLSKPQWKFRASEINKVIEFFDKIWFHVFKHEWQKFFYFFTLWVVCNNVLCTKYKYCCSRAFQVGNLPQKKISPNCYKVGQNVRNKTKMRNRPGLISWKWRLHYTILLSVSLMILYS